MNSSYSIVSDCTCDLDQEIRKDLGLDVIDNYLNVDGKEIVGSIDWGKYYTAREYYDWIREGRKIFSSQTPPQMFVLFFEERLKQNKDILYIGCSSALSNTVNSARIAANELLEKYPDRKIIVIDSLRSSLGLGLMVVKAFEMQKEGKTIDEVADYTTEHRNNVQQVGTVESLVYLRRAGRVKGFAAVMGTIIGIKPIIIADSVGMNVSIAKARGAKKAYKLCIDYVKDTIIDSENQYIYLCHSDCIEIANTIKDLIVSEIKCKGVIIGMVNPSMGNSVGPGMFGIYYYGKKVEISSK